MNPRGYDMSPEREFWSKVQKIQIRVDEEDEQKRAGNRHQNAVSLKV
jgi:hypothetical protein